MAPRLLAITVILSSISMPAIANVDVLISGESMLRACEALDKGITLSGEIARLPPDRDAYICWGFMGGAQAFSALSVEGNQTALRLCLPPASTLTQLVRIFINYGHSHPERLHLSPAQVAYQAFKEAYPCAQ
jgi:hypothetical protein